MPRRNDHLISVVLPCYNGDNHLRDAVESCLCQSYENFELIIVNDCSVDGTLNIANHFGEKDNRVTVINNKTNKKLPASLNIGHLQAKGDFVTWTSDDNLLNPNFLERLLEDLLNTEADIVFSNYNVINEQGKFIRAHKTGPIEHILFGNKVGASFLYKKKVFDELNGYDESLFLLEDYDFWLRSSLQFKWVHVDEVLYQYRLHTESLTANIEFKKESNAKHKKGALKMFKKISDTLSWSAETLDLLTDHFLKESVSVNDYLNNKQNIDANILSFKSDYFNKDELIFGLNMILRNHLLSDNCNQNIKTLFKVLIREKLLLFHKAYSKKATFKYVLKSLFNVA